MFGNLVNRHDARALAAKLVGGDWHRIARRLRPGARARTERAWSHVRGSDAQWWAVPGMQARWNALVTGDAATTPRAWIIARHLQERAAPRALSLGCGTGSRELTWAQALPLESLEGIDLSAPRVHAANEAARRAGLAHVLRFTVGDVLTLPGSARYDLVIAEQSLHHLAPMPRVLARVHDLLVPGGLFVIDEYVGPTRFQWTPAQTTAADELLASWPEALREQWFNGRVKRHVIRPSKLAMRLRDPSEAIDSAAIVPGLHNTFDVLEERGYRGAVLHLAFENIAHNFHAPTTQTAEILEHAFAFEDRVSREHPLPDDFVVAVCRR